MNRHNVFRSDRIKVTEEIIKGVGSKNTLEIGAGEYSFDHLNLPNSPWKKVDFSPPCDVICDVNSGNVTLPFSDASFDLVICTEVLEHLLWPQQLLNECLRVLSDGCKLLISVPNIASLSYRIAWLTGHIPSCAASGNLPPELGSTAYLRDDGELSGGHVIDFNLTRLVKLLKLAGFDIVKIKGSGIIWHKQLLPHWIVPVSLASNIICLAEKRKGRRL